MSGARKLQTEIDRTMKKVTEGVDVFDTIYDRVQAAEQQHQKEKYEVELKKEIKKLQRYRDQIKTWAASSEIKDKRALLDARRLIETKMEAFKVCERETKTKAYSKEGLAQAAKLDPEEIAKNKTRDFLQDAIDKISIQLEAVEAEQEVLSSKKGKRHIDDLRQLDEKIEQHRFHIDKLEQAQRLLDNDSLKYADIDNLRDDIDYYITDNNDPDFMMDDEMYEALGMDTAMPPPTPVEETPKKSSALGGAGGASKSAKGGSKKASSSGADDLMSMISGRGGRSKKKTKDPTVKDESASKSSKSAPAPASKAAPAPAASLARIVKGGPTATEVERSRQTAAAEKQRQQRAAQEAQQRQAEEARRRVAAEQQRQAAEAKAKEAAAAQRQAEAAAAQAAAQRAQAEAQARARQKAEAEAAANQRAQAEAASASAPTAGASVGSAAGSSGAALAEGSAGSAASAAAPGGDSPGSSSGGLASAGADIDALGAEVLGEGGGSIGDAETAAARRGGRPGGGAGGRADVLGLLNQSLSHMPAMRDSDRPSVYTPRNPYSTHGAFPTSPPPLLKSPSTVERFDTDTLFFIFYYQQGTYQQYLAARELKKQSWRFHKKYSTWFQRHEEPKVTTDEYEQGTYVYFDYETGWCQRIKRDFTFEYSYLEDELAAV